MRIDDEPEVELLDGQKVLRAILEHIRALQRQGYRICFDCDARVVRVTPSVPHEAWFVLDSCWQDTAAVLDAESHDPMVSGMVSAGATIH